MAAQTFIITNVDGSYAVIDVKPPQDFFLVGFHADGRGTGVNMRVPIRGLAARVPYALADELEQWLRTLANPRIADTLSDAIGAWAKGYCDDSLAEQIKAAGLIKDAQQAVEAAMLAKMALVELAKVYGNELAEGDEGSR